MTVTLDDDLHRALRLKSDETRESLSDLVSEAVRVLLAEDLEDISDWHGRSDRHEGCSLIARHIAENVTDAAQRARLEGALKTISTPTGTAYEEFLKQLEADGTI